MELVRGGYKGQGLCWVRGGYYKERGKVLFKGVYNANMKGEGAVFKGVSHSLTREWIMLQTMGMKVINMTMMMIMKMII